MRPVLSKLWALLMRRTPVQRVALLRKRLDQLENYQRASESEVRRLRGRRGETRALKWAERRLKRLRRRTVRMSRLLDAAELLVN